MGRACQHVGDADQQTFRQSDQHQPAYRSPDCGGSLQAISVAALASQLIEQDQGLARQILAVPIKKEDDNDGKNQGNQTVSDLGAEPPRIVG